MTPNISEKSQVNLDNLPKGRGSLAAGAGQGGIVFSNCLGGSGDVTTLLFNILYSQKGFTQTSLLEKILQLFSWALS